MYRSYLENGKTLWEVEVYVKDKNRKQLSKSKKGITSERKAQSLEFEFKHELQKIVDAQDNWTWKKWLAECVRRIGLCQKRATVLQYEQRLGKWIPKTWDNRLLTDFTVTDVHYVIYEVVGDQVSPTGQEVLWKLIRRIFEMAVEEGILTRNPAKGMKVKAIRPEGQVLTAVEAQVLLDKAREVNHPFWSVWTFALMSGMRSGEMYALRWTDIDLNANTISVSKQWTNKDGLCPPKWGSSRIVPISDDFKAFLIEWRRMNSGFRKSLFNARLKLNETFEDYVLPSLIEWTNGAQAEVLRDFCKVVSITPVKFHDLRATFITNLLVHGAELPKVMMIVGHRKLGTTDRYLRKAGVPVQGVTKVLGYQVPKLEEVANVLKFTPKDA